MLQTFAALSEPTRLRIFEYLGEQPRSVSEICDSLSLTQPQVSKHLRVLRESGVVDVEARAQSRIYSVRAEPLRELQLWLDRYRSIWDERLDVLAELAQEIDHKRKKPRR
ncbi:MAG TPA: metalloregulator ArsR/SmtB family transcription factor [Polyangiaceae bacterium]|nr:metalloregulator ArsR/SmtB family transcription factor [Polyangiaceae bacterium]